jgi:hypothetical protein
MKQAAGKAEDEAKFSSETSVDLRTTWRLIPEYIFLHIRLFSVGRACMNPELKGLYAIPGFTMFAYVGKA